MTFLDSLRRTRIIGILRGVQTDELPLVADACIESGLAFVEITLNTNDAYSKIASLGERLRNRCTVGAGTVLSEAQAREAVSAGAKFIVSPIFDDEVASATHDLGVPYVPGALTPKEVWEAHRRKATIVKVFPIRCYGPSYVRELRGPFGDVPLLGCGGIRPDNLRDYLEAGVDAVAVGASTFRRDWLATGNLTALKNSLKAMVDTVAQLAPGPAAAVCR